MSAFDRSDRPIVFVLKGYPRLSETFIAQEIRALEKRGLNIHLFSLRHPTGDKRHPIHDEIVASVTYLPEYLHNVPERIVRAWRRARKLPGYNDAWRVWRRDLRRDRTRNRVRRFGQALVLATELPSHTRQLHAHFLHTPASVTRYAALMTGLSWSVSAHAKDIWTIPDWEKREKLHDMNWMTTCTRFGADHLRSLTEMPDKVNLVYHGLDLERFSPEEMKYSSRDGRDPDQPVMLLSVGRAVQKKGFDVLLSALGRLPKSLHWRWIHIGGGAEKESLRSQAIDLGLAGRVNWRGAQAQDAVLAAYRSADLFVLPSIIAEDGDRDGLPNVLMEAQSQGLCCVSTMVSGIPELIDHLKTGILLEPGNPAALAEALAALIQDIQAREKYGRNGQKRIHEAFDAEVTIDDLHRLLRGPA